MKVHHIGVSVADLQRSIDFYTDMLGMELAIAPFDLGGEDVERVMGLRDVRVRNCIMSKGNVRLELFEFASPTPAEQDPNYSVANRGISHFGVEIEDIDGAYAHMLAHGVRFHAPVTTFKGGIKATYGRDPDGNVFELLEIPPHRR
jgi:catechol 2,3-dioxygenase-like lactoylglutathione lyase family enzyme